MTMERRPGLQLPLRMQFPATPEDVREVLRAVEQSLQDAGLDPALQGNAQIVLGEVLNNVVEHAFAGLPAGAPDAVALEIFRDAAGLAVAVQDRGHEMPDLTLPEGAAQALPAETAELPEGGFGWFLIRQLSRDLDYRREAGRNVLRLVIEGAQD
jgi:serine/threonine-protein kinase RsbW